MLKTALASLAISVAAGCAHAETGQAAMNGEISSGVIRVNSEYSVADTVARLEAALAQRNVTIMAKIDHAANAAGVGQELPATTLVIFGNPAAGTQLMQASRSAGIDLPMKALVYETEDGVVFEYNDIDYITARHGVPADLPIIARIRGLLGAVAAEATGA